MRGSFLIIYRMVFFLNVWFASFCFAAGRGLHVPLISSFRQLAPDQFLLRSLYKRGGLDPILLENVISRFFGAPIWALRRTGT